MTDKCNFWSTSVFLTIIVQCVLFRPLRFTLSLSDMLVKLNQIILFSLFAFFLAWALYPLYIRFLKYIHAGKQIREDAVTGEKSAIFSKMHSHKSGTPTMGGWLFLLVMWIMIGISYFLQYKGIINNTLVSRQETYVLLFGFFSLGLLWLLDDFFNIRGRGTIKWLSAKAKMVWMIIVAWFISRWFYSKLGVDFINFRPFAWQIHLWIFYPIITFFITISIVNAINITDGLDGLAGGLMTIILFVLWIVTFGYQTYIATTVIAILIAVLVAFMFFNINPAKIFMWDSWAFALWGFLASLLYILNMRMGIIIPFIIIFLLFIIDIFSVLLQIIWKKRFHRKLFAISPLHHLFEYKGMPEPTIVMKAWMLQGILAAIAIIAVFYQISG